ncbi:MAG TPA: RES family NAD+ phosphorylase [Pyrinomonadaceae bacterium]|nr:RES family NAD+ phosphorylase [Pyrinomonadaceae bacterium]
MTYAYDPRDYVLDTARGFDPDASLEDEAILYRITSRKYCDRNEIVTGNGAHYGVTGGRFHRVQQRTTYCANHAILCISEMLYRLYRGLLDGMGDGLPPADLKRRLARNHAFVVMAVGRLDGLVYADSVGARMYQPYITGPSITCPDSVYDPLQEFSDRVRMDSKNGVVYPSARQSEGFAFALFHDETVKLKPAPYDVLELKLQLVAEGLDFLNPMPPSKFDIHSEKLHPTIGYYEFADPTAFNNLKTQQLINPADLSDRGYVDFVRRRYDKDMPPNNGHISC